MLLANLDRLDNTTSGSAGGNGGAGGLGGSATGALGIAGTTVLVTNSAIVQNSAWSGAGGNGANGGNGGDNDSGPGGAAGSAGAAGMGGLTFGGGVDVFGGTVTIADSTIDSNVTTAGRGGAFGAPEMPGSEQTVQASDIFYPALGIGITLAGPFGSATTGLPFSHSRQASL